MSTQFILQDTVKFPVALWIDSPVSAFQGCVSDPFKLYMYSEDGAPYHIDLYAQNSNSIPWQVPQNKWSHLNPQWRFTDLSGNVITNVTVANTITTTFNGTTGYLASATFCYTDDMPTLSSTVTIWAVADFQQYPVQQDASSNMQAVTGFSNSNVLTSVQFTVNQLTPSRLSITKDGLNPMSDFYWIDTAIPYIVSVVGTTTASACTAVMKNYPTTNIQGYNLGSITRTISGVNSAAITWTPSNTTAYLSAFDSQDFIVGGYLKGQLVSTDTANNITITAVLSSLSGTSNSFNVYSLSGNDIRKFNESWDASNEIKKFARSPHIADNPTLWEGYMKALWGDASTTPCQGFGREAYERAANYVQNHADIDTCNIDQLYSLAQFTDVPIDNYGVTLPTELKRVMDICSINQQLLWGTRCKCKTNITNSYTTYISAQQTIDQNYLCDVCGHYHSGIKGTIFNPETYTVSAFTPFIIEDRTNTNNRFQLVIPPVVSVSGVSANSSQTIDSCNINNTTVTYVTSYPLSSYYYILLPAVFDFGLSANRNDFLQAITYFCFYNYVYASCNEQIAGIINWDDPYTTITETASSINDWYGSGQTIERIINYTLHKGLGLIGD